jgi:hypothetical protein
LPKTIEENREYRRNQARRLRALDPEKFRKRCRDAYSRNRIKVLEYHRKVHEGLRTAVLTHYSGTPPHCQCPDCNETNVLFLTIDHIHGGGHKHRQQIGSRNLYKWLIKNNFPDGFQVLCFNCNCGKNRNHGICPHKNEKV